MVFVTTSDSIGRRPILLITFALYTIASIGLVLNRHSYAGLLILRALQSLGASAVQAVTYGIIADIYVPAERGKMQGPIISMSNLGMNVGPLLGGLLAFKSGNFTWAFWGLVAFGGISLLGFGCFLEETARNVRGTENEMSELKRIKTRCNMLRKTTRHAYSEHGAQENSQRRTLPRRYHFSSVKKTLVAMNPWTAIRLIFFRYRANSLDGSISLRKLLLHTNLHSLDL